ncbi:HTH-type transcriptional regulator McbR [Escherichia coli]|nr:HTH-type transcriptional regulator McbR [Escherichia coli]
MPGTGKMKHVSLTLQVENDLKHQLSTERSPHNFPKA